jgi:hypothetical protein
MNAAGTRAMKVFVYPWVGIIHDALESIDDDLSVNQHRNAVADGQQTIQIVSDHDHG